MDYVKTCVFALGLFISSFALAEKPSFIIFHTEWCVPCQQLEADLAYDPNDLRKPLRLFVRDKVERAWTMDAESPEGIAKMAEYGISPEYPAVVVGKLVVRDGKEVLEHDHIFYGYTNAEKFIQQVQQQ